MAVGEAANGRTERAMITRRRMLAASGGLAALAAAGPAGAQRKPTVPTSRSTDQAGTLRWRAPQV